jgi:hypothetical protein
VCFGEHWIRLLVSGEDGLGEVEGDVVVAHVMSDVTSDLPMGVCSA